MFYVFQNHVESSLKPVFQF